MLRPFSRFCVKIGAIPESIIKSMSYEEQLLGLIKFLDVKVLPNIDSNTEEIEKLKNYVKSPEFLAEIDKKLDEMAEDGTLARIINEEIFSELNNKVDTNTTNINNNKKDIKTINENNIPTIDKVRKENSNNYRIFNLPENMSSFYKNLIIYQDINKQSYDYKVNFNGLKNTGGSTYYVDCNVSGTGSGTQSSPWKSLKTAIDNTVDGDTIIVKKGLYYRTELPNSSSQVFHKVNIIGEEGTIFTTGNSLTWTTNTVYENVYQANRTNVQSVIDLRNKDKGIFTQLTKVASIQECSELIGSYYTDNSIIYVNIGEEVNDSNIVCSLKLGYRALNFDATNYGIKIYMENITMLHGYDPIIRVRGNSSHGAVFTAINCKFLFTPINSRDGFESLGANTLLINCEASFNGKDGFNYHANDGVKCHAIEINCKGAYNGLQDTSDHSYNGSTVHDGCQIVRINGVYHNNNGGNIVDIDSGCQSVNINCKCYDSEAGTNDEFNTDFCCKYGDGHMYLYNCYSQGKTYKNLYTSSGATIYNSNSIFNTSTGNIVDI